MEAIKAKKKSDCGHRQNEVHVRRCWGSERWSRARELASGFLVAQSHAGSGSDSSHVYGTKDHNFLWRFRIVLLRNRLLNGRKFRRLWFFTFTIALKIIFQHRRPTNFLDIGRPLINRKSEKWHGATPRRSSLSFTLFYNRGICVLEYSRIHRTTDREPDRRRTGFIQWTYRFSVWRRTESARFH